MGLHADLLIICSQLKIQFSEISFDNSLFYSIHYCTHVDIWTKVRINSNSHIISMQTDLTKIAALLTWIHYAMNAQKNKYNIEAIPAHIRYPGLLWHLMYLYYDIAAEIVNQWKAPHLLPQASLEPSRQYNDNDVVYIFFFTDAVLAIQQHDLWAHALQLTGIPRRE